MVLYMKGKKNLLICNNSQMQTLMLKKGECTRFEKLVRRM